MSKRKPPTLHRYPTVHLFAIGDGLFRVTLQASVTFTDGGCTTPPRAEELMAMGYEETSLLP